MPSGSPYQLTKQVGYILRRANQRHLTIFAAMMPEFTPTQFATIAKCFELGPVSQNELGRQTAMDGATIKGVVGRLKTRAFVKTYPDPTDQRRIIVELTDKGRGTFEKNVDAAMDISAQTLHNLSEQEQKLLIDLLCKIT